MGQWLLSTAEHLETIISIYADMVYRLAFARCGNKYDADEIFQEVFLRYVKKQPVFHDEVHFKGDGLGHLPSPLKWRCKR